MKQNFLILLITLSLGTVQTTKSTDACTAWHLLQIAAGATTWAAIVNYMAASSIRVVQPDEWTQEHLKVDRWSTLQPRIRLAPEYQPPQRSKKYLLDACCKALSLRAIAQAGILAAGTVASFIAMYSGLDGIKNNPCN